MPAASSNFNQNDPGVVVHGSTASTARPVYHGQVFWIGTVAPTNMLTNDVWINPNGSSGGGSDPGYYRHFMMMGN